MMAVKEFKSLEKIQFSIENGKNYNYYKVANLWL